jgi:DNA polymerase III alpha subunit (gram-positive type)
MWVPRNINILMLATTAYSTFVHFGMNNLCKKYNKLFTLDHIEECDALSGCQDIRKYANMLKDLNIKKRDIMV